MTKINWAGVGQRFFEAGIERGVLYVGNNPGVPWIGLIRINETDSGGRSKPRYLDGIKISNGFEPQEFEATLDAVTFPQEFEICDGLTNVSNGLRVTRQRRRPFSITYRVKVGNEKEGLDLGYKIHILYNILAEPSDKNYQTLSDDTEPMIFSWKITARPELVPGLYPSVHYIIDSRDTPLVLLQQLEDILYGTDITAPRIPSPGELVFMFDAFDDQVYDAGSPFNDVFEIFDAGSPSTPITMIIDGGAL